MRQKFVLPLLVSCAALLSGVYAQEKLETPTYVGSKTCSSCHSQQTKLWKSSHHAWAWTLAKKETVKGNFDNAEFKHKGQTIRFTKDEKHHYIEAVGPDGKTSNFPVHSVAGIEPLQQYLIEIEANKLQAFDVAWDDTKRRWYHLFPDQDTSNTDGQHWTGPYKNWNARCAECHATNYKKNFDPRTQTYHSTQSEIGVGCEACHGPAKAHLEWAKAPGQNQTLGKKYQSLNDFGFLLSFQPENAEVEIQQCAGCHARREPFADGNPLPGTPFSEAYKLSLLRPDLYHSDGTIDAEVYVYGSFLQSKMYAKGVRCSNCHDPHSAKLKAQGNGICTQCHNAEGNSDFPSLQKSAQKKSYDTFEHHFHEQNTQAAQCKSCHMVERIYMGNDGRRDHSFKIPRPDLSVEFGTPNACNDCHADKSAKWAADQIKTRYPDRKKSAQSDFRHAFAAARTDPANSNDELINLAQDPSVPAIFRASALELLRPRSNAQIAQRTATLLADDNALVRTAASALQRGAPPIERVQNLLPLLSDALKSVRIAAAKELLDAPVAHLPPNAARASKQANREWRQSLKAKSDYPETHMIIGGVALRIRNMKAAEKAFDEAVNQDPQLVNAWRMLARIKATNGDEDGVLSVLDKAIKANPNNQLLMEMKKDLAESRPDKSNKNE